MTDTIPTRYGDLTKWTTSDPQSLPAASAAMMTSVANALDNILGAYTTAALLLADSPVLAGYYAADDAPGGLFYWSGSAWTGLAGTPSVSSTSIITAPQTGWRVLVSGVRYVWNGSAWTLDTTTGRYQLDTTNSTIIPLTQGGIGKITGNGTGAISEAVTFPTAFKTGTIPVVVSNYLGNRATGTFNAAGLTPSGGIPMGSGGPSATGVTVGLTLPSGSFSASFDYYYSWLAFGEQA